MFRFTFIIMTVLALSAGQILFKIASEKVEYTASGFVGSILNPKLAIALAIYLCATFMWLYVLKITPLRIAYPFAASAFFIVPILASYFLGENVRWNTYAGAVLISLGIWLSVYK